LTSLHRDGREALLIVEQEKRDFQLLLTDVIMPRMSGPELREEIRRKKGASKVLYMSGYAQDAITHRNMPAEAGLGGDEGDALLEKPFTKDELLRQIRAVLDKC
jgi:CheY-like chemotaxis protein